MDTAGKNRYELLFMDDDISDPLDNIVAKKKKQVKTAAAAATTGGAATGNATGPKTTTNKVANNNQAKKSNQIILFSKMPLFLVAFRLGASFATIFMSNMFQGIKGYLHVYTTCPIL